MKLRAWTLEILQASFQCRFRCDCAAKLALLTGMKGRVSVHKDMSTYDVVGCTCIVCRVPL